MKCGFDLSRNDKQPAAWAMLTSAQNKRICFTGGQRSGKTAITIQYIIARAFQYPGSKHLIFRRELTDVRRFIWRRTLGDFIRDYVHPALIEQKNETGLFIRFTNGSEIILSGLGDRDEERERAMGDEYITVFGNEITSVSWRSAQLIQGRLAQKCYDRKGYMAVRKTIFDCNPRGPRHWVRRLCIENVFPDTGKPLPENARWTGIYNWSPLDNLKNLGDDYMEVFESMSEVQRKRMRDGIWIDNEGAVYSEFDEDIHVCRGCVSDDGDFTECTTNADCPRAKAARRIIGGIDFGFKDPFVHLWAAFDGDGRMLVFDEHYVCGQDNEWHAEQILKRKRKPGKTVADHDPLSIATLRKHGVYCKKARKGSIQGGIDLIKARLKVQKDGRPRYEVCKFCVNTISEKYMYLYDDKKGDPIDANNHAMDVERYIAQEEEAPKGGIIPIP